MEVLFVDVVSMVPYQIFNIFGKKHQEIRSQVLHNTHFLEKPFGGVMVLLTGDLGQVPCVNPQANYFYLGERTCSPEDFCRERFTSTRAVHFCHVLDWSHEQQKKPQICSNFCYHPIFAIYYL